jgi:hypothetical protein
LFSLASFCIVCASTKYCSSTSSSFDSLMHIGFTNVAFGLVYSFPCQCHMLLHKKLNYKCSNCIYVLNYHLCKLYFFIIHCPFCTF